MQRAGISAARRLALLLVSVLIVSGCSKSDQLFVVRAVAAGVSSVSPFFKEDGQLGKDIPLREARPSGGVQASNSPGLYGGAPDGSDGGGSPAPDPGNDPGTGVWGGSTKPGTCAVAKLKKFLTDPKNSAKAQEWARVLHIGTDQIPSYIDQLTPVVLRHDTLVTNHDYTDGKAVSYAALLQAGIAILVDQQGLPAVKCSCGNPLLPFEGKTSKTDVQFENGNKKWADYRQDRVVVVEPPPGKREIHQLQLVDVHHPDRGIARPVGSDGSQDKSFSTQQKHAVPTVTGTTFAEATRRLTDAGLGMSYAGDTLPADGARVTASRPTEGSQVDWGTSVVLSVVQPEGPSESGSDRTTPSPSGTTTGGTTTDGTTTDGTSTGGRTTGTTPSTPSGGSSGPSSSESSGGPSSSGSDTGSPTAPGAVGGTGGKTGSSPPPDISPSNTPTSIAPTTASASASTEPPPEPTPTQPPPKPTRTAPTTDPTSARPTVSSAPPASKPVSSEPAPVDPGTSDSAGPGESAA
jgi:hypothetical protein